MRDFCARFQELAKRKGMGQADLVEALGKDKAMISKWWNGSHIPGPRNMREIANRLGCDLAWLRSGIGDPPTVSMPPIEELVVDLKEWVLEEYGAGKSYKFIGDFYVRFPEFDDWIKKRKEGGDMDALPARKVSNFDK